MVQVCFSVLFLAIQITILALTLRRLIFAEINFRRYKFCHVSRGFIFANGGILIISRGLTFTVARYLMLTSGIITVAKKIIFYKITEDILTELVQFALIRNSYR